MCGSLTSDVLSIVRPAAEFQRRLGPPDRIERVDEGCRCDREVSMAARTASLGATGLSLNSESPARRSWPDRRREPASQRHH